MADEPSVVMTIRYAGASEVRAVTQHELGRSPDGSSAIDPNRTHLNEILHGPESQQAALDQLWAEGVRRPAKQAEDPYVQMVVSASPDHFRNPGQGPGEWNEAIMAEWRDQTMSWLKDEYGDDLVHVSLHLDEDTPHMHVLIVPTYAKKPRRPGRRKRNETEEDFEVRKAAAENSSGIRTAGRSSNVYWSQMWCRRNARKSYHSAVEHLGLGYGDDYVAAGQASPERKDTGAWVREQAHRLSEDRAKLERERGELVQREIDVARREAAALTATGILRRLVSAIGDRLGLKLGRTVSVALNQIERELDRTGPAASFSGEEPGKPSEEIRPGF